MKPTTMVVGIRRFAASSNYVHALRTLDTVSTHIYNTRWQDDYFGIYIYNIYIYFIFFSRNAVVVTRRRRDQEDVQ